jgi:hypothetical protein
MSLQRMRNWRFDWSWVRRIDPAGLTLAALIPIAYWRGWDDTARTACLILILFWGLRGRQDQ